MSRRTPSRLLIVLATIAAAACVAVPAHAEGLDPHNHAEGFTAHAYGDTPVSTAVVKVPMLFPVVGGASYSDTFLACRSGCARKHFGQDLMGRKMQPLVAVFDGVVTSIKRETAPGEGNYLALRGTTGWSAIYIHINNDRPGTDDGKGTTEYAIAPGIHEGSQVFAGQHIAWLGDSGNAEGTSPHLHFELRNGDSWRGTVYNAMTSLNAAPRLAAPRPSGPHPTGTLIRGIGSPFIWLVKGHGKHLVTPSLLTLNGWTPGRILNVTQNEVDYYPRRENVPIRDGLIVRGIDKKLWLVEYGMRRQLPNEAAVKALGVKVERIRDVHVTALAVTPVAKPPVVEEPVDLPVDVDDITLPVPPPVPPLLRNGALVRLPDDGRIFLVEQGMLRSVANPITMWSWGYTGADVVQLPAVLPPAPGEEEALPVSELKLGAPLRLRDGTAFLDPMGRRFVVVNGIRRGIAQRGVLNSFLYSKLNWVTVDAGTAARLPIGPHLP